MSEDMPRPVSVEDSEILAAFETTKSPVSTVQDISEDIPLEPDSVRLRLKEMENQGRVTSKKVGARAVVWWRTS